MYRACVAVVESSRARLFTYERSVEVAEQTEQWTEAPDLVLDQLIALLHAADAQRVILCASPRQLEELRQACKELSKEGIAVYEHARDLTTLTSTQVRDYLDAQDLLPARL